MAQGAFGGVGGNALGGSSVNTGKAGGLPTGSVNAPIRSAPLAAPAPVPIQLPPPPPPVAGPPPLAPPPTLTNTAQANPDITASMSHIRDRAAELRDRENQKDPNLELQVDRLGDRMSSDTRQRAANFAAQDVNARARGAQKALTSTLARRGITGTGVEDDQRANIEGAAQRENAHNAAQIGLADENRLDALTINGQQIMAAPGQQKLAETSQTNSLYPLELSAATGNASDMRAQQNLAQNQWSAQAGQANTAQAQADARNQAYIAQLLAFSKMDQPGQYQYY